MMRAAGAMRPIALACGMAVVLGGVAIAAQDPQPNESAPSSKKPAKRAVIKKPKSADSPPASSDDDGDAGEGKPKGKTKAKGKARRGASKSAAANATRPADASAGDSGALRFSRDIAPIFVGNCTGCHGGNQPRGDLDLTTFDKLLKGGKSGAVIVAGDPESSRLVELVTSREMPRGNGNRGKLTDEAIARIANWVKAGARLDAGIDPTAQLKSYAPTAKDIDRARRAKLSPEERDKEVERVALERWKKASSKAEPEVTPSKNFLLFSNLPKARAAALVKGMEDQRNRIGTLLGPGAEALSSGEKISLYVFNDLTSYVEFVRSVESREVEQGVEAHGKLDVEQPYVVAADPLNGREEPKESRKPARSKAKDHEVELAGPERSLIGLLTEQLTVSTITSSPQGKPPRWLSQGLAAYIAAQVEPRSPYIRKLRAAAAEQYTLGWPTKSTEALGGEGDVETIRAIGFSLCEWMAANYRPVFPAFMRFMMQGQEKLDDAIKEGFGLGATRDGFLELWGSWVATRYPRR